ncbi:L-seryl-tRNA(Sec) selenium transferase, partial [Calditrichota bacterium]
LEINLQTGKRGQRLEHVIPLLRILTGTEDAVVTNNNAAAVLLCLNSIAKRKEVIISRGELVEIGGSFRMPEVMKSSGAKMIEVGATNKTHLKDYEDAINDKTGAIMLVHPSNYEIKGFTAKPEIKDIVNLAKSKNIPVIYDLGSGAMVDMRNFNLYYEPVVAEMVKLGIDLISFSGDKLLGGPQAGIIVGKQQYIKKLKSNHLLRALRCDKITLNLLTQTLKTFLHQDSLPQNNLTYHYFNRTLDDIEIIEKHLIDYLKPEIKQHLKTVESEGRIGSGAYPIYSIKSLSLQINLPSFKADAIARKFRQYSIPILGYIEADKFHINLLTIHETDINILVESINSLL